MGFSPGLWNWNWEARAEAAGLGGLVHRRRASSKKKPSKESASLPRLEDNLPALDSLPRGEKIPSRSTSSVSPLTPVSRSGRSRRAATARPMFGVCPDVGEADGLQRVPSRPRASQELRKLSKEAGKAEADGDGVVVASSVSCAGSAI
eukprot:TRINITY_DN9317_c0_g1_i15.p2 TRINITY_DN9317_c0_g1~~TRINITY_DN9317_c0_g1_i15.p2  ORF type:complete len:148 (+),score=16.13 TRINITY_DN9317_c0_g1_i15:731-1174(+)